MENVGIVTLSERKPRVGDLVRQGKDWGSLARHKSIENVDGWGVVSHLMIFNFRAKFQSIFRIFALTKKKNKENLTYQEKKTFFFEVKSCDDQYLQVQWSEEKSKQVVR